MKKHGVSKLFILFGIIMSISGCAAKEKEVGQREIITETAAETSEISESNTVPETKPEPDVVENTDNIEEEEEEKEYVFSESSERFMEKKDLFGIDQETLRIGRNEIYARHGRRFSDAKLQEYFDSKQWYEGTIEPDNFDESVLNEYEKENIKLINDVEAVLSNSSEYRKIVDENAGNAIWLLGVSNPDYEVFDNYVLVHDMYIVGAVDYSEEIDGKDVGDEVALRGSIYKITEKRSNTIILEYMRKNDNYAAPVYENTSGLYWMDFSGYNGGYWFLSRWDKGYNYYIEALGID